MLYKYNINQISFTNLKYQLLWDNSKTTLPELLKKFNNDLTTPHHIQFINNTLFDNSQETLKKFIAYTIWSKSPLIAFDDVEKNIIFDNDN